jgi:hypothetical protein
MADNRVTPESLKLYLNDALLALAREKRRTEIMREMVRNLLVIVDDLLAPFADSDDPNIKRSMAVLTKIKGSMERLET